jgi:hypothetical protein
MPVRTCKSPCFSYLLVFAACLCACVLVCVFVFVCCCVLLAPLICYVIMEVST